MSPLGLRRYRPLKPFVSHHRTFVHPPGQGFWYRLRHPFPKWIKFFDAMSYRKSTQNLQHLLAELKQENRSTRAVGQGWSFSEVAMNKDSLTMMNKLDLAFTLSEKDFAQADNTPDNYRFIQCGMRVKEVNRHLERKSHPKKSLPVSGASHGQTLVGVTSTCTHGSGITYGPTSDIVRGMHIICKPNDHVWLESAEGPHVSEAFLHRINHPRVIRDTDLFKSAMVGLGAFGIIHGVLVEVEDVFLLDQWRQYVPWSEALEKAITDSDYSGLYDPDPKKSVLNYAAKEKGYPLWHFEMKINPYRFWTEDRGKGVYLRTMHKTPYREGYHRRPGPFRPGEQPEGKQGLMDKVAGDILSIVETVANKGENEVDTNAFQKLVGEFLDHSYRREQGMIVPEMGTIGETFDIEEFTIPVVRPKIWDASFVMDRKNVLRAMDLAKEVMLNEPYLINGVPQWVAVFELRFLRGTDATLGMIQFPETCVFELVGMNRQINQDLAHDLAQRFREADLKFAMHWGKEIGHIDKEMLAWNYAQTDRDKLKEWKQQRSKLMTREEQGVFNNDYMETYGLDEYVPTE